MDPLRDLESEEFFLENIPALVSAKMNNALTSPPTPDKIKAIVFSFSPDKTPGSDGFSTDFYQKFWEMIRIDMCHMVGYSFKRFIMAGGINTSFLALIPKESNPSSFSRFCPISLCNVSYKFILKLLASRIKSLLPLLISANQGGFVLGRQIFDNVILLQEDNDSSWRRGDEGMIIKLDMTNVFDRVIHSFLLKVLKNIGFDETFIKWISLCISSPWIAL